MPSKTAAFPRLGDDPTERDPLLPSDTVRQESDNGGWKHVSFSKSSSDNGQAVTPSTSRSGSYPEFVCNSTSVEIPISEVAKDDVNNNEAQESKLHLAITMVLCLFSQFFTSGTNYSLSVMYVELIKEFDSTRAEAALVQSMYMASVVGLGILWAVPTARLGPGSVIMVGSLIGSVGFLASAFAPNVATIIACTGVVSGFGLSIVNLGPHIVINARFGKYTSTAIALQTTGGSLGQFGMTYLMEILLETYAWNGTFLIMSGMCLNCMACGFFIHITDPRKGSRGTNTGGKTLDNLWKPTVFKDWRLVLMSFAMVAFCFAFLAESRFLVDIVAERGFGRDTGALFASLIGVFNFLGRIIATVIKACVPLNSALQCFFMCIIVTASHTMILYLYTYAGLLSGSILNGLGIGLQVAHLPIIIRDICGKDNYAATLAMMNVLSGFGSFFGGYIGGYIKDTTGEYNLLFYIAIGTTVACGFVYLVLALANPKKTKNDRNVSIIVKQSKC